MPVPGIAVSPGPAHPLLPGGCLKPEIRCGCRLGDVVSRVPLWRKLRAQCVIGCVHPRQAQGPSQPECPPSPWRGPPWNRGTPVLSFPFPDNAAQKKEKENMHTKRKHKNSCPIHTSLQALGGKAMGGENADSDAKWADRVLVPANQILGDCSA